MPFPALASLWLAGVAAMVVAMDIRDPMLFEFRPWLMLACATASVVAVSILSLDGKPWRRLLLVTLWTLVPLTAVVQEARLGFQRRAVTGAGVTAVHEVGRHIVAGYDRVDEVAGHAAAGRIGGIFITRRNVAGRSADEIRAEIAYLQGLRRTAGLPRLIVATDQEGGIVSRLSPPLSKQPALADLTGLPPVEQIAAAFRYGAEQGHGLADLGITLNFAPVLDLRVERPPNPFDLYSRIERRAIDADPQVVTRLGHAYVAGLASAGVAATAKHFPGLGPVAEDTHFFAAEIVEAPERLEQRDWLPFRTVLAETSAALMIGHVTVSALDTERSALRSAAVVDGLLRNRWDFDGVIVTDDLCMGPAYHAGLGRVALEALNAGVDLLLIAYDPTQVYPVLAGLLAAHEDGRLDPARLARSRVRLDGQYRTSAR